MPGISTIITDSIEIKKKFKSYNRVLNHEEYFYTKDLLDSKKINSFINLHESYPSYTFEYDNNKIFMIGEIYNFSTNEIFCRIKNIVNFYLNNDTDSLEMIIKKFINEADGDFNIQIITENEDLIFFNDLLSRLPLYYYFDVDKFICASEIKTILLTKDCINISKLSFLEFVLYEYNFDRNTIYSDIFKLTPGSLLIYKKNKLEIIKIDEINFITNKDTKIEDFLDETYEELKNSIDCRVKKLSTKYNLLCDISGGLDSRTVAGILSNYPNITYQTFEYVQDESLIAKKVLSTLNIDIDSKYIKYSWNNNFNYKDSNKYVFINDGLVNYYSTSICYKDLSYIKNMNTKNSIRFTGLGISDFMRKYPFPFMPFYNLTKDKPYKFSYLKNFDNVSRLVNIDENDFISRINNYFADKKEKTKNDILKRLYFEFQLNYVSLSSEDRERIHFWTVPVMWTTKLMKKVGNQMSLNWTSYDFFIKFLKLINPKLIEIKLYNRKISIKNRFLLKLYDKYLSLKFTIKFLIETEPFLNKLYCLLKKENLNNKKELISIVEDYSHQEKYIDYLLANKEELNSLSEQELMRIITIFMYLNEFTTKHNKEVIINEK